jgi:hypothetical protein
MWIRCLVLAVLCDRPSICTGLFLFVVVCLYVKRIDLYLIDYCKSMITKGLFSSRTQ